MNRRQFFGGTLLAGWAGNAALRAGPAAKCGCVPALAAVPRQTAPGRLKVTGMHAFGVTIDKESDRPYVFVKIETDAGVVGWGEATLEGKAGAVIATIQDLREYIVGADPLPVEHLWQSIYVHAFYRAGPILGSALSGIDQALWDIRGKIFGQPVYRLLGGPQEPRGVRGYYHARAGSDDELKALRDRAQELGVTAFKSGIPGPYEWIETHQSISRAVQAIERLRLGLGDGIDIGIDFHAKTSPTVATIICRTLPA
jgi:galactonate dehydratase